MVLLNRCGGRLSARGAHDILGAIAEHSNLGAPCTSRVLRHSFGNDLMGHTRLVTLRVHSLPTDANRRRAIDRLRAVL